MSTNTDREPVYLRLIVSLAEGCTRCTYRLNSLTLGGGPMTDSCTVCSSVFEYYSESGNSGVTETEHACSNFQRSLRGLAEGSLLHVVREPHSLDCLGTQTFTDTIRPLSIIFSRRFFSVRVGHALALSTRLFNLRLYRLVHGQVVAFGASVVTSVGHSRVAWAVMCRRLTGHGVTRALPWSPVAGATQVSRSFSESLVVSVVLAELAVLLGIAVAYYGGVTAGGVIVLVAVGIYVCAVALGKLQTARGEQGKPDMGSIEANSADVGIGSGDD